MLLVFDTRIAIVVMKIFFLNFSFDAFSSNASPSAVLGIIIFLSLHIETVDKSVFIGQNWELELGLLLALGGSTGSQLSLYFVMQLTAMHSEPAISGLILAPHTSRGVHSHRCVSHPLLGSWLLLVACPCSAS